MKAVILCSAQATHRLLAEVAGVPLIDWLLASLPLDRSKPWGCEAIVLIAGSECTEVQKYIAAHHDRTPFKEVPIKVQYSAGTKAEQLLSVREEVLGTTALINSDVLAEFSWHDLWQFHTRNKNIITSVTCRHTDTGIYLLEPHFLEYLARGNNDFDLAASRLCIAFHKCDQYIDLSDPDGLSMLGQYIAEAIHIGGQQGSEEPCIPR